MNPTLPDEMIAIILSYLPVISLLRFKTVCRSWLAMINSPKFINYHLSNSLSTNSNRFLVVAGSENTNFYTLDFENNPNSPGVKLPLPPSFEGRNLSVGGSCNGVFCLYSSEQNNSDIILLNPSTRTYKVIPAAGYTSYLGFGYDAVNDDYKAVWRYYKTEFIRTNNYRCIYGCMIYSLKNDSWKSISRADGCVSIKLDYQPCGVLVKSHFLHWIVRNTHSIIRFDVCDEKWTEILGPQYKENCGNFAPPHDNPSYYVKLGNLGGSLCFYAKKYYYHLNIWIMKEYGVVDSWVKIASIKEWGISRYNPDPPFAISRQGNKILMVNASRYDHYCPRFFWYDLHDKTTSIVPSHGIASYVGALLCDNTLTRLNGEMQIDN